MAQIQESFGRYSKSDRISKDVLTRYILGDYVPMQFVEVSIPEVVLVRIG